MMMICLRGATWRLWPCRLYAGVPNSAGYGAAWSGKFTAAGNPLAIGIHRKALQDALGRDLRPGCEACHHCDVKLCYEPHHLYEGTRRDNMADAKEHGFKPVGRPTVLSSYEEDEIRRRYAAWPVRQRDLAAEYGVCQMTISNIVRR